MKPENSLRKWQVFAVALSAFALIFPVSSYGQATDSIIVGVVTDSTGSGIPGASVVAANKQTGVKYQTVTVGAGEYRINNVPIGAYDVRASAAGFANATAANAVLELNRTTTVNLTLSVGAVSTSVEVTAAGATLDTSTAQLQTNFDSHQAVNLPTAGFSKVVGGAGIYNLSLTGAGVTSSGGVGQGFGPSVGGQRADANSFNIDGVANDDHYNPAPQIATSNEAVAEFTLLQNQFSAEFGGAGGGIFNVIVKSGTNALHGSLYEYNQNRNFNAVDAVETHQGIYSNPRYDNNRLGATVGGPIIKDRLFYFGNYEYNPLGQASQPGGITCAPTQSGINTLNGLSGLSKNNLSTFQKYVPVAAAPDAADCATTTVLGQTIPLGALSFASPDYFNTYNAVVAIDYNLSAADQIRGRYFYSNTTGIDANANLPAFFVSAPAISHAGSISWFHNISPTMENELRISYDRFNASTPVPNITFPGFSYFPNIAFDDLGLQLGPDTSTPSGNIENKFQIQENLTKTLGRHTIKAGYNLVDVILTGYFVQRSRGDYDYTDLEEYLLDHYPTGGNLSGVSGERSVGSSAVPFGFLEHAAYVQDDFRLRPNLTLNLGLRYEYVTIPVGSRYQAASAIASVPGVITFAEPKPSKTDFSPRIGFNYSPGTSGQWSIRGGFARSFYNTYINLNQNASPPYFATTVDCPASPSCTTTNFLANGGLQPTGIGLPATQAAAAAAVASYTFNGTRPYALTGTLGVQRAFGKDYTFEARYVYTKGVHLYNQTRLNKTSPITATVNIPTYLSVPSAATLASLPYALGYLKSLPNNDLAQYGFVNNITGYHPWGNSRYNGLQLQLNKRYSANFSLIGAYTWSHAQDDSTATNFSTILSPRRAQDFQNLAAEWASSALDRRHRLTLTPVYDFRPFQNGNWLLKNIVGNWNISGTYTFQSPEYATVQSGVDANLNGDSAGDRAIINPNGAANVGSGVVAYNAAGQQVALGSASIVAYVAINPNARYIQAQSGAYANGGRNTFPLDSINNIDASLSKKFNFTERYQLEFGMQAFNVLNHSQFIGGYLSDVNAFATNAINRTFLVPGSPVFGAYPSYFPSNSRQLQLVARFHF